MTSSRRPLELRLDLAPEELIFALAELREIDAARHASRVAALVEHPNEEVRHEALRVLCLQWQIPGYHDLAVRLLQLDPSEDVQCIAAFATVATSTADTLDRDVRVLLEALDRGLDAPELARAAYASLLLLLKRQDAETPDAVADFDPDTDVDWVWVASVRADFGGE